MTDYHYTIEQPRAGQRSLAMFDFSQVALIDDLLAAHEKLEENRLNFLAIKLQLISVKDDIARLKAEL